MPIMTMPLSSRRNFMRSPTSYLFYFKESKLVLSILHSEFMAILSSFRIVKIRKFIKPREKKIHFLFLGLA